MARLINAEKILPVVMDGPGNEYMSDALLGDKDMALANDYSDVDDVDDEITDEADEGIAIERLSTITLASDVLNYPQQYGRTYHAYRSGKYLLPNDEREKQRLDLQHNLWLITLDQKLFLAPVVEQLHMRGGKVLDMGTGTGIWAIDFADQHPYAEVIGIDLSPIQPTFVSPNVAFQIDDLEELWTQPADYFTFIHGRMLFSCFSKPADVIAQAYNALRPGGFLEMQDALLWFQCDSDEESLEGTAMHKWAKTLHDAAWKARKDWVCPTKYKQYMKDAGFINVTEVQYKWPINTWPTAEDEQVKGRWSLQNILWGLESLSLAPMIQYLGMTEEEVRKDLERVKEEIQDREIHAFVPIYVVYGQKPDAL